MIGEEFEFLPTILYCFSLEYYSAYDISNTHHIHKETQFGAFWKEQLELAIIFPFYPSWLCTLGPIVNISDPVFSSGKWGLLWDLKEIILVLFLAVQCTQERAPTHSNQGSKHMHSPPSDNTALAHFGEQCLASCWNSPGSIFSPVSLFYHF